jgi:hypothetical protein
MSGKNSLSNPTLMSRQGAEVFGTRPLLGAGNTFRSGTGLRAIETPSQHVIGQVSRTSSTEQINRCMMVLLLICLAAAGAALGVVGYLRSEQLSALEARFPSSFANEDVH